MGSFHSPAVQTSRFASLKVTESDEVFQLMKEFKDDEFPKKVLLGAGVYRDEDGRPVPLPVVRKVEREFAEDPHFDHEYLPIQGSSSFLDVSRNLIFGTTSKSPIVKRIASVQTISGTGANHVGARYLADLYPGFRQSHCIWIPDPTWANHHLIWEMVGDGQIKQKLYPYFDAKTRRFDFDGMIEKLEAEAVEGDVILLHACAHNPTGLDPTHEQWQAIADVCERKGIFPFFDAAYIGFASGYPDEDAWSIRYFAERGFELTVAQSFSKNFGLYGERVGALHVLVADEQTCQKAVNRLENIVRAEISMAPAYGSKIVSRVLGDAELTKEWIEQLQSMSFRIIKMRKLLYDELKRLGTPGIWDHIITQIGMFSYTGLTEAQVVELKDIYHIYLLKTGRACISGLTTKNVAYVAKAIDAVVRK